MSYAATRRKSLARAARKPENAGAKKYLRAQACPGPFESFESGGAKSLLEAARFATLAGGQGKAMLERTIDRIETRLAPHARAISIAAVIWFWLGIAFQARFLPLPALPRTVEGAIFWFGIAANALWWGLLNPAIQRRRKERAAVEP